MICNICQTAPIDTCFEKCGHLACTTCSRQLFNSTRKCHICRARIEKCSSFINPIKDELNMLEKAI
eukprot:UN14031